METKTVFAKETGAVVTPGVQGLMFNDLTEAATETESRYDPEVFAAFLRNMKGSKSSREFADENGLSESFVAKAVSRRQLSRPSKRTLLKLLRAKTDVPVDRRELVRAAGYETRELELEPIVDEADTQNVPTLSTAAVITRCYGQDPFTAMRDLMRALADHGLNGDMGVTFHHELGYFEITDVTTGQVYAGINAYLRPAEDGEENDDENAVFSIAFSVGLTYNRIMTSEGAKDKIVYILTDNEKVYEGCRSVLPKNKTKATVVLLTDDHEGFRKEDILSGSEHELIRLVD